MFEPISLDRRLDLRSRVRRVGEPGVEARHKSGDWLAPFRKDILIDVFNEAGQLIFSYKVHRCWASEYQALPDPDANADAVAIEHIKLENEEWERDSSVTEPKGPTSD
jgi:phage tail-like protein